MCRGGAAAPQGGYWQHGGALLPAPLSPAPPCLAHAGHAPAPAPGPTWPGVGPLHLKGVQGRALWPVP
eukprot:15443831-Alexandrium_andersonii.AAC.1